VNRDALKSQLRAEQHELSADVFRLLVDTVQDYAIFVLDPLGFVATWNVGAERIKGYAPAEIIGRHFSTFYPPEDIAADKPRHELQVAREQGRIEDEGWRLRKDGSRFWANVIITALRDPSGKLTGFGKVTRDLTKQREADEELRRSEERFRLLVEGVRDYAIYMLDPDGRVATWNSGAEKIKGYEAHEIIGKSFSMFFTEEARAAGDPRRELEIARSDGRFEEEGWRIRKDGSRFWASVAVTAIHGARGELLGFAKVTRDLTARRAGEETARQLIAQRVAREVAEASEARLRDEGERYRRLSRRLEVILEGVGDGISAQDRTGRLRFANSAAARTCGFDTVEELLDADTEEILRRFEVLDEQGRPFDFEQLPGRRAMVTGQPSSALLRVRNLLTGKSSWSRVRASAVLGSDGEPELAVNIWHDISEQRQRDRQERFIGATTSALASSLDYRQMLATLAHTLVPDLADWCAIHLLEGTELKTAAVAHVDPQKLVLAHELQLRFPPDPNGPGGLWKALRTGQSSLHEEVPDELLVAGASDAEHLSYLRKLDVQSTMVVPIVVRDRPVGAITLISSDPLRHYDRNDLALAEEVGRRTGVSVDNARLFEGAQAAAKRAEEASKIKDEFLATVSHELRTPLGAIVGWSVLLRDRNADPAMAKGIEVIHRNAQAQAKIIDDILDVSRIVAGNLRLELKQTDLAATIRAAMEVVATAANAKHIALNFVPPLEPCLLTADHERLQQVVWNLLSNAVRFTDDGGRITITLQREGTKVMIIVEDTGRGIDAQFLPHVFERFKQGDSSTTRRVGGLGLGLAIVRHIVELHGGQTHAHSAGLGRGSAFTIILPDHPITTHTPEPEHNAAHVSAHPLPNEVASLQGLRVLLVDDEPDSRELLEMVLAQAGATVTSAGSAREAFELLQSGRPNVLVSDIGMPDEDGYAFIRRVRALDEAALGRIPSLALTAYTRGVDRAKALAVGFTAHMGKPVNPDELVRTVARLMR